MTKTIKYVLGTMGVLFIVGSIALGLFLSAFRIFGAPEKEHQKQACDYDGIRRANLYRLSGNSTTNPSVHVTIGDCNDSKQASAEREIFTADMPGLQGNEVKIRWISFNTLEIGYRENLRVFIRESEVIYPDSSLNLHIIYAEIK